MEHIINRAKAVLSLPNTIWPTIEKEKGMKDALLYGIVISLCGALITFSIDLLIGADAIVQSDSMLTGLAERFSLSSEALLLIAVLIGSLAQVIGFFVGTVCVLLAAIILRIHAPFNTVFRVTAYSLTPGALFSGIPFIGSLTSLWTLLLFIMGLKQTLHLSYGKNLALFLLSSILPIVIVIFVFLLFASSMHFAP